VSAPAPAGRRMQAWRRWRRSIQARLVLLFVLLALGTTGVFLLGTQRLLAGGWQGYAKPLAADYVDRLAAEIGSPPSAERALALTQRLPISVRIEGPLVQFESHPRRPRVRLDPNAAEHGFGLARSTADGHSIHFGLAAAPDPGRPRVFGWITLAALLALTAAAYATVRRQLRPLQDIGAGVLAFGQGRFDTPIPVRRHDELGDLASRINSMATSLQGMLDAKRALLLAMSHELRSPLTRARVNAELLDDSAERSALLRDLGEMRELITSLLESERLAQGHSALQAEAVDLGALAQEVVQAMAALPGAPAVTLQVLDHPAPVQADPTRLRLLLRNLLENALRHGADPGTPTGRPTAPTLFLRRESDGRLALGVRDFGPGVPADQLAQLAQAFYRPDSARTRASGGVGLGLYLCRLVAQAHGGELRIRRAEPGLEVAMVWAA
jgi:signal transduction histidine kinase